MHLYAILTSILLPVALARDGCVQYACKDMLACTQFRSAARKAVVTEGMTNGVLKYWGRDKGQMMSDLKPNMKDPMNTNVYREKNCNVPGSNFSNSFNFDYSVWRSPHTAGNFYVDYTTPSDWGFAVRVRGWCEWVKRVDC